MYTDAEYDRDTTQHIELVRAFIERATTQLTMRAAVHDASKFFEPERSIFRDNTANRDASPFGTDAYRLHLLRVKPALDHHYANNRHHPEYHANGVRDMTLIDLLEMVCDWMSASMKTLDGDVAAVHRAIRSNQERFGYSDDVAQLLHQTVTALAVTSVKEEIAK